MDPFYSQRTIFGPPPRPILAAALGPESVLTNLGQARGPSAWPHVLFFQKTILEITDRS